MMKKDAFNLWEQEGDLERMKLFFQEIRPDSEQKERIKKLALEKIQAEEIKSSREESPRNLLLPELAAQESFRNKLIRSLKSFWWRWQWKLAVPVAAVFLVAFIGLGMEGFNKSFNDRGSIFNNAKTQSSVSADAAGAAPEIASVPGFTSNKQTIKTSEAYDASKVEMGVAATNDNVGIMPIPEEEAPPADEALAKKITYFFDATLQVEDVAQALEQVSQAVISAGGYIVEASENHYQNNSFAHATYKIPSDRLEGFKGSLSEFGKVINNYTDSRDVTNEYYDAQARLNNLRAQEQRYLEILKEAKTVDEILSIESYLSSTRMQIEQLQGQIKLWDHQVSYSTVTINFQTTPKIVNVNDPWQPVSWANTWQAIKDAILKTISSTWNGLNYLVVGIAYASPYLLLGAGAFVGYRVYRKRKRQ